MNPRLRVLILSLLFIVPATTMAAQGRSVENYERVLLPILMEEEVPGAYGARWKTNLWIRNEGDAVDAFPLQPRSCISSIGCLMMTRDAPALSGHETAYSFVYGSAYPTGTFIHPSPSGGGLVYVEKGRSEQVRFSLHLADLSRREFSAGTLVPVIRESDAFTASVSVLNVPLDSAYRVSLRLYEFDSRAVSRVSVRIWEMIGHNTLTAPYFVPPALLAEDIVELIHNDSDDDCRAWFGCDPQTFKLRPGFAFIADLRERFPGIDASHPDAGGLRVEIEPLTPGLRFGVLASLANNETNHVTLFYPE